MADLTIGVLALQGAFIEHIALLQRAAADLSEKDAARDRGDSHAGAFTFTFTLVRTPVELAACSALIIPGGESTAISLIASRTNLLEPLRQFVKVQRKPVWGTCAGLIFLAEEADRGKKDGQELIGGLDVRVVRNWFGRQVESFEADLRLPFLRATDRVSQIPDDEEHRFHAVFIRAPVVQKILPSTTTIKSADHDSSLSDLPTSTATITAPPLQPTTAPVEILARLPGRAKALKDRTTTAAELGEEGDIVAVKQGNVFGTAFHPELTGDPRIHRWWLGEVVRLTSGGGEG